MTGPWIPARSPIANSLSLTFLIRDRGQASGMTDEGQARGPVPTSCDDPLPRWERTCPEPRPGGRVEGKHSRSNLTIRTSPESGWLNFDGFMTADGKCVALPAHRGVAPTLHAEPPAHRQALRSRYQSSREFCLR